MASIAGTTGIAGATHYSAAKGGIIAFTKALAREVGGQGILVNAIAPGYIDTPLLDVLGEQRATQTALIALQTVLGRLGEAREVAETALFLAGPGATYFTGQVLSPNGGEVWPPGSTQKISWSATDNGSVSSIDIDLSTDGGATYPVTVATGLPNTGTYTWTVSNNSTLSRI